MQNPLIISCLKSHIEDDGTIYGKFLFGGLQRGIATTIATGLRRSLLSEVSGWAITHAEFFDIPHEYSTLPGTHESVLNVLLNLKKLIFTVPSTKSRSHAIGYCSGRGPGVLTGRDLKLPPGVQCINPDQVIATLANGGHVQFSVLISHGKQYVMHSPPHKLHNRSITRGQRLIRDFEEEQLEGIRSSVEGIRSSGMNSPVSIRNHSRKTKIFRVDAAFMPVLRVSYSINSDEDVFDTFPSSETNLTSYNYLTVTDRLTFEVWTNGSVTPRDAMHQASIHLLHLFSNFQISLTPLHYQRPRLWKTRKQMLFDLMVDSQSLLQSVKPNQFLLVDIGILPISPAIYATLKANQIHSLRDFVGLSAQALHDIPGMTNEILFELLGSLRRYGIRFFPSKDSKAFKDFQTLMKQEARRREAAKIAERLSLYDKISKAQAVIDNLKEGDEKAAEETAEEKAEKAAEAVEQYKILIQSIESGPETSKPEEKESQLFVINVIKKNLERAEYQAAQAAKEAAKAAKIGEAADSDKVKGQKGTSSATSATTSTTTQKATPSKVQPSTKLTTLSTRRPTKTKIPKSKLMDRPDPPFNQRRTEG